MGIDFYVNYTYIIIGNVKSKIMLSTKKFIEKAHKVHQDKYDYSKTEYRKTNEKVCIICPIHGEFWQTPNHHLQGCGCPKCGRLQSTTKLTYNEFIEKAKKVHGDKYDYSKVIYRGWDEKVCIICPIHGEFWQQSCAHIARGHGCPQCAMTQNKEYSLSQGIITFQKLVNTVLDKYEVDISQYQGWDKEITVVCKKHGSFTTTPTKLKYTKNPCPHCREELKKPKKEKILVDYKQLFIDKLEKKYPNRFNYENLNYINADKEITLYDSVAEINVTIKPSVLLKQKLDGLRCYKNSKLPTVKFIEKARKVHDNKYDYSKTMYIDSKSKVCIICPEHGEFYQTPNEHLKGSGCSKCANNIKMNVNDFLEKAKKVHGDKYDYSKMVLKKQNEHITLICPEHGEFQVRAMHHLRGSGCPKCKGSGGEIALLKFFESKKLYPHYNKFYKWLNNLQLDFYFPEYHLAIEVQGKQHFRESNFFQTRLETQIKRDKEKKELCEKNGVKLLYYANFKMNFPYEVHTDMEELYRAIQQYVKL